MDENEKSIRSQVDRSSAKLSQNLDAAKSKLSASIEEHNSKVQAATDGLKEVQKRANFKCRRCGKVSLLTIYRANEVVCGNQINVSTGIISDFGFHAILGSGLLKIFLLAFI